MVRKAAQEVGAEAKKVGDILKEARMERKFTFEKVAEGTKISVHYLRAIEENDFASLPGYVYASGFIRTYAKFLGLDVDVIYDMYRNETSYDREKVYFVGMEPEKENGLPHKKELVIAAVALLFIYVVWSIFSSSDGNNAVKKLSPSTVVQQDIAKANAKKVVIESISEKNTKKKSLAVENINTAATSAATSVSSDTNSGELEKKADDVVKSDLNDTVESEPVNDEIKVYEPKTYGATGETRVVLVANSEVWVQVSDDDKVVLSRTLKPGDKYSVPDDNDDLVLRVGNAAGLDVFVDGVKRSPLGKRGKVLRNLKIDAESLLNRD